MNGSYKFRICMIINRFHPIVGGAERQALLLSDRLCRMGHQVAILTRRITSELPTHEEFDGMKIRRLEPAGYSRLTNYLSAFSCFTYLLSHGRRFDVLHCHSVEHISLAAILAARLIGRPIICKVPTAGDLTRQGFPYANLPWYVRLARRIFFIRKWRPVMLRWTDAIIAPSEEIRQEIKEINLLSHHRFIPNGIDTTKFHPISLSDRKALRQMLKLPLDSHILIFVGRLVPRKGIDILIKAWPEVIKRLPEAFLVICGSGQYQVDSIETELISLVSGSTFEQSVKFLGNVANVDEYLKTANLFIFPSRGEGLPNALLEAMATGLPIVASNVGGVKDLIHHEDTGHIFNVKNQDQLIESIHKVLTNPKYAQRLGESARRFVEDEFSIDTVLEKYIDLYETIRGVHVPQNIGGLHES